jgi:histidyl-tRNA synthetase
MEYANLIKAKKLIVIGENEVKSKMLKIKDMISGKETEVKWNDLGQL